MLRRAFAAAFVVAALTAPAFAEEAATAPAPAPVVTLHTTLGDVEITLDPVGAPKTSAHMLRLFKSKHYFGASIFRIEKDFLIQTGDLDAALNYRRPPIGFVELETANNSHGRGKVALARDDAPNSGRSSFYIDLAKNSHLNADPTAAPNTTGYAVFGRVTKGLDVVDAIARVELDAEKGPFPGKLPKTPVVIQKIAVTE